MRASKRQVEMSIAGTELEIKLHKYWDEHEINEYVEVLRLLTLEMRSILLFMEPRVSHAERFSGLKDLIRDHQKETGMTDIEVLQALTSHMAGSLKYMLRYERHGDYETPAGLDKE